MNQAATHRGRSIRSVIRKISATLGECAYAQRRLLELTTAPDRYLPDPDTPPETYAEFLFRTSGVLRREPAARCRH